MQAELIIRDGHGRDRWVDGHAAPVRDAEGRVIAAVVVFPEITDRRTAELEAQQFRRMADASPDFIGVARPNGTVRYINPAGLELIGRAGAEVAGMPVTELHPEAVHHTFQRLLNKAKEHGYGKAENALQHQDGTLIPVEQVVVVDRNERAEVEAVYTTIRDLRPMRALEARMREGERLESIGRLAGGVAHDFNNLLTVINSYTEMVHGSLAADDSRRDDLEQVILAGERAADLCRQLLGFASRQIIQPARVDSKVVLHELMSLFRSTLGEDILVESHIDEHLWPVLADRAQLDQVLMNLVVNAREAMPDGGRMVLEAHNEVVSDSEARLEGLPAGDYVVFSVTDTGVGIPTHLQDRVFEPFFTTRTDSGTGLGLATVHGAVRQNRGHIELISSEGEGATFTVHWPRAHDPETAEVLLPPATSFDAGVVLLVEDEANLRELVRRILQKEGMSVLAAAHGPEALALLDNHDGPVDLLLTDVVMPHMKGTVLAGHVVARHPGCRVLFMSGYNEEALLHQGVAHGGVEFLAKPFLPDQLRKRVHEVLERSAAPR